MRPVVQLIDDLEDAFLKVLLRRVRGHEPTNLQVLLRPRFLWNQGVRCFLHSVMEKVVAMIRLQDEAPSNGLPKAPMNVFPAISAHRTEGREVDAVSEAGKLL